MKAAIRNKYGPPSVLKVTDIEKPVPQKDEVLIRVHNTTVSRTDCGLLTATPVVVRLFAGFTKPNRPTSGTDFSGVVVEKGSDYPDFEIGDRVFGFYDEGLSTHAEYVAVHKKYACFKIPKNISFLEAAASCEGAHYAYSLLQKVNLQSGQSVLVNGATGAIGSALIQLLRSKGVRIVAVAKTGTIELVKSLGSDQVLDYKKENFRNLEERFDFIFDTVVGSSYSTCKHVLKPKGIYVSSELGTGSEHIYLAIWHRVKSIFSSNFKRVIFPLPIDIKKSLVAIKAMLEKGNFNPVIDSTYSLDEIDKAYEYVLKGHKTGNVIIQVLDS